MIKKIIHHLLRIFNTGKQIRLVGQMTVICQISILTQIF